MSFLNPTSRVRGAGFLAALALGVATGLVACSVGTPWSGLPGIALLFVLIWYVLAIGLEPVRRAEATSRWDFFAFLRRVRRVPKAIQLLILTFFVTSMFVLEMKIDITPNQYGFLELLMPVFLGALFFDLSGGLFAAAITAIFAFLIMVPPRYAPIFTPGPELHSLAGYAIVSIVIVLFTDFMARFMDARAKLAPGAERMSAASATEGLYAPLARAAGAVLRRELLVPAGLVCVYALFWAVYGAYSSDNGPHIDSLEAYAWGREFQMGYFKHPPFWGWVTGAWFLLFPKTPFFFYLLSEFNSGLGLLGTWALMGRFCKGAPRQLALILLLLTPFYQFNALRFNANTILLSIWPWTMYYFVCSIEDEKQASLGAAVACGVLAGFALLSKYFGVVLIGSCFVAAMTHDNRRAYFMSAAPYVSLLAALVVFAPHVVWLVRDGFQPLFYLASKGMFSEPEIADSYFTFIVANILYFVVPLIVLGLSRFLARRDAAPATWPAVENGPSFLTVLALAPFVLTLVAGAIGHTALAVPFGTPIFGMAPLVLVLALKPDVDRTLYFGRRALAAVVVGVSIAGVALPYINLRWGHPGVREPFAEVAELAPRVYERATGAPVRYVTGSVQYALTLVFLSKDNISDLRSFNFRWSPWVTPGQLRDHGLLIICEKGEPSCAKGAEPFLTPDTKHEEITVARKIWNFEAPSRSFELLMVPPRKS